MALARGSPKQALTKAEADEFDSIRPEENQKQNQAKGGDKALYTHPHICLFTVGPLTSDIGLAFSLAEYER